MQPPMPETPRTAAGSTAATSDHAGPHRGELYPQHQHELIRELPGSADEFDLLRERALLDYGYHTARAYWGDLEHWRDWCVTRRNPLDPLRVQQAAIRRYLATLAQAGYSPNTRARRITALRKLFQHGLATGTCDHDPTATMTAPPRRL